MCIRPILLLDGSSVACRECWQCLENKINDYVGRNIAESLTATTSLYVTLTYGRVRNEKHHPRSLLLTYSDVQKAFKRLRWHGYEFSYLVAGEYGAKYERAHWHVILHFKGKVPPGIVLDDPLFMWARFDAETGEQARDEDGAPSFFWEHGFAYIRKATHETVRYCCKYVQKDMADEKAQAELHYSTRPPLGQAYFYELAERHVAAALAPQHLFYSFPEVTKRKQGTTDQYERIEFMLRGRMAELYIEHFIAEWRRLRPTMRIPASPVVDAWLEYGKLREPNYNNALVNAKREAELKIKARDLVREKELRKENKPRFKDGNLFTWQVGKVRWNEGLYCWEAPRWPKGDSKVYWMKRNGVFKWVKGAKRGEEQQSANGDGE